MTHHTTAAHYTTNSGPDDRTGLESGQGPTMYLRHQVRDCSARLMDESCDSDAGKALKRHWRPKNEDGLDRRCGVGGVRVHLATDV